MCPDPTTSFNFLLKLLSILVTVPNLQPAPVMHSSVPKHKVMPANNSPVMCCSAPRHKVLWPVPTDSLSPAQLLTSRRDDCCRLGWVSCMLLVQDLDAGRGLASKSLPIHPRPSWLRWKGQTKVFLCSISARAYLINNKRLARIKITKQYKEKIALRLGWTYGQKEPRNKIKKDTMPSPWGL